MLLNPFLLPPNAQKTICNWGSQMVVHPSADQAQCRLISSAAGQAAWKVTEESLLGDGQYSAIFYSRSNIQSTDYTRILLV
jgi:hypothetical protein